MTEQQKFDGFTDEERDAMKAHAKELKTAARRGSKASAADGEADLLESIAKMPAEDAAIATRLHAIVKEVAPSLTPKTWYGQPAYANPAGKVVCFFQSRAKFKTRYCTLGFNEAAQLDDGDMWATAFALEALSPAVERKIADLVKRAAG